MAKVGHHGDDVVLNITKIQTDVHPRRYTVVLVAALGEALQNICLASQKTQQTHDILAEDTNLSQESVCIIGTSDEYLIFNGIGIQLNPVNDWGEGIDDVVTFEFISASLLLKSRVSILTSKHSKSSHC